MCHLLLHYQVHTDLFPAISDGTREGLLGEIMARFEIERDPENIIFRKVNLFALIYLDLLFFISFIYFNFVYIL